VLELNTIERHNCIKVNILIFNGEFAKGDKRANKSNTKNYELFQTSNLREWYKRHESTLASLEEGVLENMTVCCRES